MILLDNSHQVVEAAGGDSCGSDRVRRSTNNFIS